MKVARGTLVDTTIINAPSSTRNKDKTRKGNPWYFGMEFDE